jgi:dTDP-4-dehydrorhamnose reductase
MDQSQILVTGGSGLLGTELKKLLPNAHFPSSSNFNITNFNLIAEYIAHAIPKYSILLHCAAFTSPPLIDIDPLKALDVNIIGTANVVKICALNKVKLVYISTDYVFNGEKGNYDENDPVYPVNKYAWSKLGGEAAVRMYENSLIIRLSFGPKIFPYEKAFKDQWTSRIPVDKAAEDIVSLLDKPICGTIHLGGVRQTVLEYAKKLDLSKEILPLSINDVNFTIPKDTSLNTDKFKRLTNK